MGNLKIINFEYERKYINDFIGLTKKIYREDENMENSQEVKKLLLGIHPLNRYFRLYKFIVLKEKECVGRFCITAYPDDENAYIGFYECIDDDDAAAFLFDEAYKFVRNNSFKKIIGPVDASFWNKYRLKINLFDKKPYTGEPYNKDYYLKQFKNNNYHIIEHYTSNIYDVVSDDYDNEKFRKHYSDFLNSGYEIRSPKTNDFEKTVEELYPLLTALYSDFPVFKNIEKEDFCNLYNSYKKIMNMNMIKMAYYNNELVGFFVSMPNYGNIVYHLNLINILKIMSIRKNPKEYVLLYMGVHPNHRGLGKALASSITEELRISKLPSIGALARDGKITQNYADDLIEKRYEYVLLEREAES